MCYLSSTSKLRLFRVGEYGHLDRGRRCKGEVVAIRNVFGIQKSTHRRVLTSFLVFAVVVALATSFAAHAFADIKTTESNGDTMILQNDPDKNYGLSTSLRADGDNPGGTGKDEEALVKWDLSDVPPGTGVVSASVTLTVNNASKQTYEVYKLKRAWKELAATWNVYDTGQPWEVAGAKGALDRGAEVGTITASTTGKYTFTLPPAVVQGWVDDPATNHGIIIADAVNDDSVQFYSRQATDPSQRPKLTVDVDAQDITPPETTIDSGPSGTGNGDTASFTFSSPEPESTFQCRLDGAAYEACISPKAYTGLAGGQHTFEVRAVDVHGNADRTPASRTWTVGGQSKIVASSADTRLNESAPSQKYAFDSTFSVYGGNSSGSTKDAEALLKWDLSDIPAGTKVHSASVTLIVTAASKQTFEVYKLKRAWKELAATWNVYDTGQPWEVAGAKGALDRDATVIGTITPTATGKQTFTLPPTVVQGWVDDPASNHGIIIADASNTDNFVFYSRDNAYYSQRPKLNFEIDGADVTPPETIIDSGPLGEGHGDTASFRFSAHEPGPTFECRLDGLIFEPCASPKAYTGLAAGQHTFEVRATDALGNTDATPDSQTWEVGALEDPVLVGAGDIASGVNDNDEATATLLRNIPGTVFTVGDNVYNCGTLAEFNSYYDPTWGTEKARTKPTPGNHDDYDCAEPWDGADYFSYFGEAAAPSNDGSYSYDLGDWHIVALNTAQCYGTIEADGSMPRCGPGDPMLNWLEADLQANQKSCTLAYLHDPRFASATTGGGDRPRAHWIWEKLYAHDAEVVVSGNHHFYERFAPQTPSGAADPVRGIQEFVVGTGGKDLFQFGTARPNSVVRNTGIYGVIKFTLHPGSYDWEFVTVAGQTFSDSGSANCH
jgi:hypothetical protein